jgi:hypothetical protein
MRCLLIALTLASCTPAPANDPESRQHALELRVDDLRQQARHLRMDAAKADARYDMT